MLKRTASDWAFKRHRQLEVCYVCAYMMDAIRKIHVAEYSRYTILTYVRNADRLVYRDIKVTKYYNIMSRQ